MATLKDTLAALHDRKRALLRDKLAALHAPHSRPRSSSQASPAGPPSRPLRHGRATIYKKGGLGMVKVEVSQVSTELTPYAQYQAAVRVRYTAKGKRTEVGYVDTYQPTTLVLDGWGHPAPDSIWDEATRRVDDQGTGTVRGRYTACDPRWQKDFDRMIAAYIARTGAKVLRDFRGHNAHDPMAEANALADAVSSPPNSAPPSSSADRYHDEARDMPSARMR